MIKAQLTNSILNDLIEIEKNKERLSSTEIPLSLSNQFRKNTRKKSSFASNKIEGNPLTYEQAEKVIEEKDRHFLKPEQEIRNYYRAIQFLDEELAKHTPISKQLILDVQKLIVDGESKDKIGLRGPMPPGILFAVYDSVTGEAEYIPPEYSDVPSLLDELVNYILESSDHPVIKSAVFHYQLVTIHPFEDGNGRTARIMANYILSYYGYSFKNIGSLEEYFSFDLNEYYSSLQMNLPALYYSGRDNPPHPEIWINYYLKVMKLYASKVVEVAKGSVSEIENVRLQHLSSKASEFLAYLKKTKTKEFTPVDMAKKLKVTNRTIIYWCKELCDNGYLVPNMVKQRIRSYSVR